MLLNEVLPNIPIALSNKDKAIGVPNMNKSINVGVGAQGFVYKMLNKPGKVVKVALLFDDDAYEQYIRVVLKYQKNPYFPKIYNIKKYPLQNMSYTEYRSIMDKLGDTQNYFPQEHLNKMKWFVVIVMEELLPISISRFQLKLKQLLLKIYGMPVLEELVTWYNFDNINDLYKNITTKQLIDVLMEDRLYNLIVNTTTDANFKNALRLIHPLIKRYVSDIRSDNIMLRKDNNGDVIPVFIDPVINVM